MKKSGNKKRSLFFFKKNLKYIFFVSFATTVYDVAFSMEEKANTNVVKINRQNM